jgi:hypothetical protein
MAKRIFTKLPIMMLPSDMRVKAKAYFTNVEKDENSTCPKFINMTVCGQNRSNTIV